MPPNEQTVNRVGVGVDLFGGPDVLTNLRAIRQEMLAINQLAQSTKIPNNISGLGNSGASTKDPRQQALFDFEKEQKASNERIITNKRDTNRRIETEEQAHQRRMKEIRKPVTEDEVTFEIAKNNRKKSLNDQVVRDTEEGARKRRNAIVKQLQEEARLDQEDLAQKNAYLAKYRAWVVQRLQAEEAAQKRLDDLRNRPRGPNGRFISNQQFEQEQREEEARTKRIQEAKERANAQPRVGGKFVSKRETEALQDAEEIRNREQVKYEREQREQKQRDDQRRRQDEQERRAIDDRIRNESKVKQDTSEAVGAKYTQANYRKSSLDLFKSQNPAYGPGRADFVDVDETTSKLDKARDRFLKSRQQLGGRQFNLLGQDSQKEVNDIYAGFSKLGIETGRLKAELNSLTIKRPRQEIISDLKDIEREEQLLIERTRRLKESQIGLKGPGGPGGSGPNLRDPQGLLNDKGFFTSADALGRITRNILLYEVVSRASYGLVDYIGKSVEAAKKSVEFGNALRFATESAHGNIEVNNQLVESTREIGLSRQQGRQAVTEAARFTEERPQDIGKLVNVATNIAAERGGGVDKTDELIEQLRRRESKFYKRIFGKTVEEIYNDEAETTVRRRPTLDRSTVVGENSSYFKTQREQIKEYVAAMTDAQKENAVLNYVLSQSSKFQGEAAERAQTLAGRIDRVNAAFTNAQEGVGLFITEIKPVNNLLETLAGKSGALDFLRAPQLGRSGQGGTITNADIENYGRERTQGGRGQLLNTINEYGTTALGIGGLLASTGLLGRRPATESYRRDVYSKEFDANRIKFDNDLNLAQREAINSAKDLKPGLLRSVVSGMQKITLGMSESVLNLSAAAAQRIGAESVAEKARMQAGRFSGGRTYQGGQVYSATLGSGPIPNAQGPYQLLQPVSARTITETGNRYGAGGGTAGGLAGGLAGAYLGSVIADKVTTNSIIATGITILGGVAGTTAGTAGGEILGSAIGTRVGAAGGLGSLLTGSAGSAGLATTGTGVGLAAILGLSIGSYLSDKIPGLPLYKEARDTERLRSTEAGQSAFEQQAKERKKAFDEGRIKFYSTTIGDDAGAQALTGQQVAERVRLGKGTLGDYRQVLEIESELTSIAKLQARQVSERNKFVSDNANLDPNSQAYKRNLGSFEAGQRSDFLDSFIGKARDEAQTHFAESEAERLRKEEVARNKRDQEKQDAVNQQANALSKLRDAQEGSFRQVETVAGRFAGPDNPYVKVFSDGATAAQRMQQQYGFLGKATVDYFTSIEKQNVALATTKLRFSSLTEQQNLLNKASREGDERTLRPGYSTKQNLAAETLGSLQTYISESARLKDQAKDVQFGAYRYQFAGDRERQQRDQLKDTLSKLNISGLGSGASSRQIDDITSQAILSTIGESGLNPAQLENDPYLKSTYLRANRQRQGELFEKYQDSIKKAQFQDNEDVRLRQDLDRTTGRFGGATDQTTKDELNKYIIGRTEGIDQKDLTFEQFQQRQNALKEEARRSVEREEEARRAMLQGLEYQKRMDANIESIRRAIVAGDLSMLIQVQNDSQARVDRDALKDANPNFKVALDQGQVKTNPNTPSTNIYGAGGRKK